MNEQNTKYLLEKYPKLYRQAYLSPQETCMCWLFETGDGWYDIINELSEKLETLNNTTYIDNPIEAEQVKEKFGGLRFYVNSCYTEVHDLITAAEIRADATCERCGKAGKSRGGGWILTLCDECNERKK